MPLDPVIAGGFRGIELQSPLEAYGRIAQLQQAQNQNALAQYQLGAAQRAEAKDIARTNALAQAGTDDTSVANALLKAGDVKGYSEFIKSRREMQKAETDLADAKLKQARGFLDTINPADPNAPAQYIAWHEANHRDPVLGPLLAARGITADQSRARIQQAIQQGPQGFAQLLMQSKLGTEEFIKQNKPQLTVIDQSGQRQIVATPGLGLAPPTTIGTYADVSLPPEIEAQKARIAKAGASSTNVLPQEKAELGARGKLLVDQYKDVSKAASLAAKTLPSIETQQRILDSGFKTGFGTETQKAGASVLAALGVPEAEKFATDAQTFLSATQQAVLQKQLEQKGAQTEADAQRITQTGAQLGNTVDANKFIVSVAKAQLKRDIDQRNFYDKWWKTNKTYDGAEDAWFSGEGGKSLFDQPELKRYAGAAPKAPQQAAGRAAPMSANAFADADKERRYQEWKAKQGLK